MLAHVPATVTLRAFSFASTMTPKDLAGLLPEGASSVRITKTQVVASYGAAKCIVGYDFGALVFVDIEEAVQTKVLEAYVKRSDAETRPPTEEAYAIDVDPDKPTSVGFDRMVVRAVSQELIELTAFVLAQSAAMEYYEDDVDRLFAHLKGIAEQFAAEGRFAQSRKDLLRFVGSAMVTRNEVVFTLSLLDTPTLAWNDEALDRIYRDLRALLEIGDRYRALDHKLTVVRDNLELLVDLTRQRRSLLLELSVLALIAVEVVLVVWQIFGSSSR
jgi:uncharacterized Rmd1/YagE family protein